MKRIVLALVVCTVLAGCGTPAVMRSGKICIEPVTSTGYSTSDPIDIRQDVVTQAADMLHREMVTQIGKEQSLTYVPDCTGADFVLITKLKSLDAEMNGSRNFWTGRITSERAYTMSVVAHLDNGGRKPIKSDIFVNEDGDKLSEIVTHISENIIDEIRELPKAR